MNKFTLAVDLTNDAFADDFRLELARILRETATRVMDGQFNAHGSRTIFDSNGNDVGRGKVSYV